jgi:hypothetical protein
MISQEFLSLLDEAKQLHTAKNAGYSGIDNPDPWANFRLCEDFGVPAHIGCMIRMSDKWKRIINLLNNPQNEQVGEAIRDTLMDLSIYSLIMICLLKEYNDRESNSRILPDVTGDRNPASNTGVFIQGTFPEIGFTK